MRRRVGVVTLVFMIAVVAWGTPPTEARTGLTTTPSVPLQLAAWTGTAHYQQNKGLEYDCQTGQGAGHCRTFINWSIDYSISRTGVTNGTTFVGHWFYRETFDPDQPPTFGC